MHDLDDLIIDEPHNISLIGRLVRLLITLFFWVCMFYLWQPLISLVAWSFEIKLFYEHIIILGGFASFRESMLIYLAVIVFLGGSLILWAKTNQWRFRGKERRTALTRVSATEIARFYNVPEDSISDWQKIKNCTVYFDENNQIKSVEKNQTPPL